MELSRGKIGLLRQLKSRVLHNIKKRIIRGNPRVKRFKDVHKGERCFIIGTGPSLNVTNFDFIKDEIIFGVNTLYTGLLKFGITCDYYAVSDVDVRIQKS